MLDSSIELELRRKCLKKSVIPDKTLLRVGECSKINYLYFMYNCKVFNEKNVGFIISFIIEIVIFKISLKPNSFYKSYLSAF